MADLQDAQAWVDEVEAAYANGGYAAGDGPPAPLDEMKHLVAEVERLREGIRRHRDMFYEWARTGTGPSPGQLRRNLWAVLDKEDGRG